jgi:DeoR family transcriptional regulator of aga operon
MLRHLRLTSIVELVAGRGSLSIDDVVDLFEVSAATARRDLDELADQQLVRRTRGGAVAHTVSYDLPLRYKSGRQPEQKQRIAAAAAELIPSGAVIGINGGTTNTLVARGIATRADLVRTENGGPPALSVVTNALNIANELAVRPQLKIVVIGGVVRPQSFELIGPFGAAVLTDLALDVMVLGVDAISPDHGAGAIHEGEAEINKAMVDRCAKVIVVADGTKVGKRAFCGICPASRVDILITDVDADRGTVRALEALGVDVRLV